jgi:ribosome-associated translation inhibitor RaiA
LRFIDQKIKDLTKDQAIAPTEEMRETIRHKIATLKRKRASESIDDLRLSKSKFESRALDITLSAPSVAEHIMHALDESTIDTRIESRLRRLELTAESPLMIGEGLNSGDIQVLRKVSDTKLYDDETIEAAKKSEQYAQLQKVIDSVKQGTGGSRQKLEQTRDDFNRSGDVDLSKQVSPVAKLKAYADGWDLFTQEEKEAMQNDNL